MLYHKMKMSYNGRSVSKQKLTLIGYLLFSTITRIKSFLPFRYFLYPSRHKCRPQPKLIPNSQIIGTVCHHHGPQSMVKCSARRGKSNTMAGRVRNSH